MKIRLDENIGRRGVDLLTTAGHDVVTVRDQNLQGVRDEVVFKVCADEDRVLVTSDHDFGQVLRFPADQSAGLVILELGARVTPRSLLDRLRDFLALVETQSPVGALWIVEPGRVRIHLRRDD
jgi:predicted nuclease of predicted toxin-antitoxin system